MSDDLNSVTECDSLKMTFEEDYKSHSGAVVVPVTQKQPQIIYVQPALKLGSESQQITCPDCKKTGFSKVIYERGLCTWLSVAGICLVG
jgi:hypothetical protein